MRRGGGNPGELPGMRSGEGLLWMGAGKLLGVGVKGGKGDSRIFFWNIFLIEFNNFLFNILIEIYFTYHKI